MMTMADDDDDGPDDADGIVWALRYVFFQHFDSLCFN